MNPTRPAQAPEDAPRGRITLAAPRAPRFSESVLPPLPWRREVEQQESEPPVEAEFEICGGCHELSICCLCEVVG